MFARWEYWWKIVKMAVLVNLRLQVHLKGWCANVLLKLQISMCYGRPIHDYGYYVNHVKSRFYDHGCILKSIPEAFRNDHWEKDILEVLEYSKGMRNIAEFIGRKFWWKSVKTDDLTSTVISYSLLQTHTSMCWGPSTIVHARVLR